MKSEVGFLDTSVIVRYLVADNRAMAEQAAKIIESDAVRFVAPLVLLETAFVLASVYKVAHDVIVDALTDLLGRENIQVHGLANGDAIEALSLCRDSKRVSFADAMLWAQCRASEHKSIFSFDKKFPSEGIEVRERG